MQQIHLFGLHLSSFGQSMDQYGFCLINIKLINRSSSLIPSTQLLQICCLPHVIYPGYAVTLEKLKFEHSDIISS